MMRRMNIQQTVFEFPAKIDYVAIVIEFLLGCADIMQVTPSTIHIDMFPSNGRHPIGFTAAVSFQESYCILDTWPEEEYCHLNLVSCKAFDETEIQLLIRRKFGVDQARIIQFDVFKRSRSVDPHGT